MKAKPPILPTVCTLLLLFFAIPTAEGQILKKLKKRAEKAAEEAVIQKTEEKVYKETSRGMDSILNPKTGKMEPAPDPDAPSPSSKDNDKNSPEENTQSSTGETESLQVYKKFDFVPGDQTLFFDDFKNDFIGDFPSKWNTNAGGELVTIGDSPQKWLELKSGFNIYYVPDVPQLPEEYTIEFDIAAIGLDRQTSSTSQLRLALSDDDKFKPGSNYVFAEIPFCQYSPIGVTIENKINGKREIRSTVKADLRDEILEMPHISIAVNKQRFRLWVNEVKYIDVPRLAAPGAVLHTVKFLANGFKDGKEQVFISNLKVAEGGVDLRRKLISEGKISTNAILFESGSANLKPQSMGVIRQISQVLLQEKSMNLKIIGHTDSDGSDENNQVLSAKRAEAVKEALVSIYNIAANKLTTEGKGESEPIGDNATEEGKAQNRRVEFIKQ